MSPLSEAPPDRPFRDWAWLVISIAMPLPWLYLHYTGQHPTPEWTAAWTGLAILASAFLLSWATELAEQGIPQSLALLVLAPVSVLPEYAEDLSFAIKAAGGLAVGRPLLGPARLSQPRGSDRFHLPLPGSVRVVDDPISWAARAVAGPVAGFAIGPEWARGTGSCFASFAPCWREAALEDRRLRSPCDWSRRRRAGRRGGAGASRSTGPRGRVGAGFGSRDHQPQ